MIGLENYYRLNVDTPVYYDEVWVIMRFPPKQSKERTVIVKELSPSVVLWRQVQAWKESGDWGEFTFEQVYAPRYIQEIADNAASLDAIAKLLDKARRGLNIALACTCYTEGLCHRAVLGGILQSIAPDVEVKALGDYRKFWNVSRSLQENLSGSTTT